MGRGQEIEGKGQQREVNDTLGTGKNGEAGKTEHCGKTPEGETGQGRVPIEGKGRGA